VHIYTNFKANFCTKAALASHLIHLKNHLVQGFSVVSTLFDGFHLFIDSENKDITPSYQQLITHLKVIISVSPN